LDDNIKSFDFLSSNHLIIATKVDQEEKTDFHQKLGFLLVDYLVESSEERQLWDVTRAVFLELSASWHTIPELWEMRIHANPTPGWVPNDHFCAEENSRIFTIVVNYNGWNPFFQLVTRAETFLGFVPLLHSDAGQDSNVVRVPWIDWGPTNTCLIPGVEGSRQISFRLPFQTYGSSFVEVHSHPTDEDMLTVSIYDFNLHKFRIEQSSDCERVEAVADSSPNMEESDQLEPPLEDITTSLPYIVHKRNISGTEMGEDGSFMVWRSRNFIFIVSMSDELLLKRLSETTVFFFFFFPRAVTVVKRGT
jgi:hypothetical protein